MVTNIRIKNPIPVLFTVSFEALIFVKNFTIKMADVTVLRRVLVNVCVWLRKVIRAVTLASWRMLPT